MNPDPRPGTNPFDPAILLEDHALNFEEVATALDE